MSDESTITRPISNLLLQQGTATASLIVLSGLSIGRTFRIRQAQTIIGRAANADIQIDDESISRHHVVLHQEGSEVTAEDFGSKNGTLLNGTKLTGRQTLVNGDKLQIGATVLRFSVLDPLDENVQQRLYDASIRDGLTQAFNRRFFDEVIQKEFLYADRHAVPLTLCMIDIDRFKLLNDTRGHQAGDAALVAVSASLQQAIRGEDVLARYGGEEFALILRELNEDVAFAVAERLRKNIETLNPLLDGVAAPVTVSVGLATHMKGTFTSAEELIGAADALLFTAKTSGRNRVCSRSTPSP